MNKRAVEVSPPPLVVVIILVLLVLLILMFIFGDQTRDFLQRVGLIKEDLDDENCENMIFGRSCDCIPDDHYDCKEVAAPPGKSWDCNPCYRAVLRD